MYTSAPLHRREAIRRDSKLLPNCPFFKLQFRCSFSNLLGVDHLTRVNCSLYHNDNESENWGLLGTSSPAVVFSRNVDFEERIPFKYVFEKTQLIKIDIFRLHDGATASSSDDLIGSCIFKVDELIGSFGLHIRRSLYKNGNSVFSFFYSCLQNYYFMFHLGFVYSQMPEKEQPIIVQLHGRSLDRKDLLWDETAVFFRVFRLEKGKDDDELVLLYESEAIKNHSHPQWPEFRIGAQDAADNRNRLLEIWVMYRDVDGTEGFIGKFLTTYAKMKYGPGPDNVYAVINETKQQQKKNYENSGRMELVKFTDVSFFSFLDYIVSGTQLHYEVAVDFSYGFSDIDQQRFDVELQMAIRAIGGILRDYTPNRLFPAFGMGAKIPPTFHETHEFHLNFNVDPTCRGLDGIIDAYRKAQALVTPIKTSKFTPIVALATRMSHRSGFRGLHYHVLVIFTRGTPTDIKELSASLTSASSAPLSVVIVGIGSADFSQLVKLASRRREGTRTGVSSAEIRSRIAQKALCTIPQQMTDFMHAANIAAKPPIQVCRSPLFHSSSLIPDRPTQFFFDGPLATMHSPQLLRSDRRGSDSQYLDAEIAARSSLSVRVPERCHSVLQTSREQYQRRLKERGLGRVVFPRIDLSTVDSSISTQDGSH
ncbi:unnamed protein product [Angiostrongylus costaricensis]|uniref:Copine C-terminal domain-containing protein n=1 Tax=Angiostrongylus costaricensis TaxID=334426 RepID=A0A3P7H4V3_ANGCS|nr:unnamed protein product [Angiostrongylus costaricensis]